MSNIIQMSRLKSAFQYMERFDKNITLSKMLVLLEIFNHYPEVLTGRELYRKTGSVLTYQAMSKTINRFCSSEPTLKLSEEGRGFLYLTENPEDKREKFVNMTDKGLDVLSKFEDILNGTKRSD